MPGPFTVFEAEDPSGAAESGNSQHIASLAVKAEDPSGSVSSADNPLFGTPETVVPLESLTGQPVPLTGQMFPVGTA